MQIGVVRRALAFVAGAVFGVVVVTSALTHNAQLKIDPASPFGLRVAHPLGMTNVPPDLIPIP